jgi:isocitrate/isopropylmalate dehydrogenase
MADKSNAMTDGHALWQRVFGEVAAEFPGIEPIHLYVDALTMQMVKNPGQFQVIVTNNMFGDIVTDLGAQLQGGLGMAASGNLHPGRTSMFEPVHGSAPKYAGKNVANPIGAILSRRSARVPRLRADPRGRGRRAARCRPERSGRDRGSLGTQETETSSREIRKLTRN